MLLCFEFALSMLSVKMLRLHWVNDELFIIIFGLVFKNHVFCLHHAKKKQQQQLLITKGDYFRRSPTWIKNKNSKGKKILQNEELLWQTSIIKATLARKIGFFSKIDSRASILGWITTQVEVY